MPASPSPPSSFAPLPRPPLQVDKTVFMVFFNGERARAKILQSCEAFGANLYPFPEDAARQRQLAGEVTARLRELSATLEASTSHTRATLTAVGAHYGEWSTSVRQEKASRREGVWEWERSGCGGVKWRLWWAGTGTGHSGHPGLATLRHSGQIL